MKHVLKILFLVLLFPATSRANVEINVAAAASLREVFPALKTAFEKEIPSITLLPVFGSSGLFTTQIEQGAPFDLLLAADQKFADVLIQKNLSSQKDTRVFAWGRLAFWVSKAMELNVKKLGLGILKSPKLQRVVFANPALAPYGRAAAEVMTAAGAAELCPARCLLAQDAGQAALMLDNGGVDAGFVPLALVIGGALGKFGDWIALPAKLHSPLPNTAVVVRHPKTDQRPDPSYARRFMTWLGGPKAQAILHKAGY